MPQNAHALIVRELGGPFTLEDIIVDDIRPGEALVKIEASGICRTDLHCAAGHRPVQVPAVFGHEGRFTILFHEDAPNVSRCRNCAPSRQGCDRSSARRQSLTQLLYLSCL
jgi:threonine dehydrogenase-like Zn-dependent dehydrogenase